MTKKLLLLSIFFASVSFGQYDDYLGRTILTSADAESMKVGALEAFTQGTRSGGANFAHGELLPKMRVEKAIGVFPADDGVGYSTINLYKGYSPEGLAGINGFSQDSTGKYIAQWFMGTDVAQPRVGVNNLPPMFVLFGVYDTSNVAQDMVGIMMEDYNHAGVGLRYRGDMGFGGPLSIVTNKYSFQLPSRDPSTQTIFNVHRAANDSPNVYQSFTHGSDGWVKMQFLSNGAIWIYDDSSGISPYAGLGWKLGVSGVGGTVSNDPFIEAGGFAVQTMRAADAGFSNLGVGSDAVTASPLMRATKYQVTNSGNNTEVINEFGTGILDTTRSHKIEIPYDGNNTHGIYWGTQNFGLQKILGQGTGWDQIVFGSTYLQSIGVGRTPTANDMLGLKSDGTMPRFALFQNSGGNKVLWDTNAVLINDGAIIITGGDSYLTLKNTQIDSVVVISDSVFVEIGGTFYGMKARQ